jgi:signal transduction histidine kinase
VSRRPRPVQWLKDHTAVADALLTALLLANFIILWATVNTDPNPRKVVTWVQALGLVAALSTFWRRKHPVAIFGGSGALVVLVMLARYHDAGSLLTTTIAAYSVGAHVPQRRRRLQVAAVAGFALVDVALVSLFLSHRGDRLGTVLSVGITFAAGLLLGDNLRSRRDRLAYLRERNDYLERTASLEAANAAAAERTRIARELHDIVAHSVSVIAVQAGGARRLVHTKPETAVEALTAIEHTARETMRELRQLLGVLRSENPDDSASAHAPQPGLDDVRRLVKADPALDVTLAVEGERREVPGTVNLAAYRIVQEAITNVRKHAGPASVNVHIAYRPDAVDVTIEDNGRGAAAIKSGTPGFGLTGMTERAALCGGSVATGPRPGGGWSVRATLPTMEHA